MVLAILSILYFAVRIFMAGIPPWSIVVVIATVWGSLKLSEMSIFSSHPWDPYLRDAVCFLLWIVSFMFSSLFF